MWAMNFMCCQKAKFDCYIWKDGWNLLQEIVEHLEWRWFFHRFKNSFAYLKDQKKSKNTLNRKSKKWNFFLMMPFHTRNYVSLLNERNKWHSNMLVDCILHDISKMIETVHRTVPSNEHKIYNLWNEIDTKLTRNWYDNILNSISKRINIVSINNWMDDQQ